MRQAVVEIEPVAARGPRVGRGRGNGRTAVRSSYALNYDFAGLVFPQNTAPVQAAPFDNRVRSTGDLPFANPYQNVPGGQQNSRFHPHRFQEFDVSGLRIVRRYGSQHQLDARPVVECDHRATDWRTGRRCRRAIWAATWTACGVSLPINPGVYPVPGSCTLQGTFYPVCTIAANPAYQRRALSLQNPVAFLAVVECVSSIQTWARKATAA